MTSNNDQVQETQETAVANKKGFGYDVFLSITAIVGIAMCSMIVCDVLHRNEIAGLDGVTSGD